MEVGRIEYPPNYNANASKPEIPSIETIQFLQANNQILELNDRIAQLERDIEDFREQTKDALEKWLHDNHPSDECGGECITTRNIFLSQACQVIDSMELLRMEVKQ